MVASAHLRVAMVVAAVAVLPNAPASRDVVLAHAHPKALKISSVVSLNRVLNSLGPLSARGSRMMSVRLKTTIWTKIRSVVTMLLPSRTTRSDHATSLCGKVRTPCKLISSIR